MPDCIFGAPKPGTYNFALVRRDWDPRMRVEERNATSVHRARCVDWPKDIEIPHMPGNYPSQRLPGKVLMIFVNDRHLCARLTKLGWKDVTSDWMAHVQRDQAEGAEPEPRKVIRPVKTPKKPAEVSFSEVTKQARG